MKADNERVYYICSLDVHAMSYVYLTKENLRSSNNKDLEIIVWKTNLRQYELVTCECHTSYRYVRVLYSNINLSKLKTDFLSKINILWAKVLQENVENLSHNEQNIIIFDIMLINNYI